MIELITKILKSKWVKFVLAILVIVLVLIGKKKETGIDTKEVLMYSKELKNKFTTLNTTSEDELNKNIVKNEIENQNKNKNKRTPERRLTKKEINRYRRIIEENKQKKQFRNEIEKHIKEYNEYKAQALRSGIKIDPNSPNFMEEINNYYTNLKNNYDNKKATGKIKKGQVIKDLDYVYVNIRIKYKDKKMNDAVLAKNNGKPYEGVQVIQVDSKVGVGYYTKMIGKKIGDKMTMDVYDFMDEQTKKDYEELYKASQETIDIIAQKRKELDVPIFKDALKKQEFIFEVDILDVFDKNEVNRMNLKKYAM